MLRISEITKSYNGKENALNKVSFQVNPGEICGLIGNNGAGKSTIIRSIVGAQDFDSGEIWIDQESIKTNGIACKQKLGYIPDNQAVYHYLTGREYLNLISSFYDFPKEKKERKINDLVSLLQLDNVIDQLISSYSKGMKQKILIIAAILHEPDLIIMDEPFTGLDPSSVQQMIQVVLKEKERGAAILFSSHMLDIVRKLADKIVVIQKGIVLIEDDVQNVNEYGRIEKILVGEMDESTE